MNIGDVCTREVVLVDSAASLRQAAELMREYHVGALVVTQSAGEGAQVSGIVTDRDVVVEAVARGLDTAQTPVGRLASGRLAALPAHAAVDEAISLMKERGVRRLLVAGDGGHLHGIVSLDDLLGAVGHEMAELAHSVHKGMERERAERKALPKAPPPQKLRIPLNAFA